MKTKHKFHEVLQWVANGEELEVKEGRTNRWYTVNDHNGLLADITKYPCNFTQEDFRLKPSIPYFYAVSMQTDYHKSEITFVSVQENHGEYLRGLLDKGSKFIVLSEEQYNNLTKETKCPNQTLN